MATPVYQGLGQPQASTASGFLGRLGSFFGGAGTPQYLGSGQPSLGNGSLLGSVTTAYKPAPVVEPQLNDANNEAPADACASCPIDPAAIAAGSIAIVIPRERLGPWCDEVAATD